MALTGRKDKTLYKTLTPQGVEDLYLCLLDWSVNEVSRLLFIGELEVVLRKTWNSGGCYKADKGEHQEGQNKKWKRTGLNTLKHYTVIPIIITGISILETPLFSKSHVNCSK